MMDEAAREAAGSGGALGVYGGDGTVDAAAAAAVRHGVPLAVFPGGTRNHFAARPGHRDLGERGGRGAGRARRRDRPGATSRRTATAARREPLRQHLQHRRLSGAGPDQGALVAAAGQLAGERAGGGPRAADRRAGRHDVGGRRRRVWLLFAGNCRIAAAGSRRCGARDLADGSLDVRIVDAGHHPRSRLVAAALTGGLGRKGSADTPVYTAVRRGSLRIEGL